MATTLLTYDATCFDGDTVPVAAGDKAAYFDILNGRTVLVFPDGSDEYTAITRAIAMPQAFAGGALTAIVTGFSGATANEVRLEIQVEAITPGDSVDKDGATSFDTENVSDVTVAATAGHPITASISLTNADSVAAGDMVRFLIRRDSDHANDDAAASFYLEALEIRE